MATVGVWRAVALHALVLGIGCDGGDDDGRGDGGADKGDGGGDMVAAFCRWQPDAPPLTLPRSEVRGVLRGTSRNPSTTCTRSRGTGGPEAIYVLRVTERTVVDLEVISSIDTVVAIRRACDDPLTEVACNDNREFGDPGNGGTGGSGGGGTPGPVVPPPPPTMPFPGDAGPGGAAAGRLQPGWPGAGGPGSRAPTSSWWTRPRRSGWAARSC